VTLLHARRFTVLPLLPPGSTTLSLPDALVSGDDRPRVLARIDLEEMVAWERPRLTTLERGRDFYAADENGRALVRVGDDDGRLHPDVELHLGAPPVEHQLRGPPEPLVAPRKVSIRAVGPGDVIYVIGRSRPVTDAEAAGLREPPLIPCFSGALGPLYLYDEAAFRQLAAWHALPWYRKLSLMVRNR
jgi:hypothetical protein